MGTGSVLSFWLDSRYYVASSDDVDFRVDCYNLVCAPLQPEALMRLPIHALEIVLVVCGCSFIDAKPVGGRFHIIRGADVDTVQRDMFSITELSSSVFMEEVGSKMRGQVDRVD